MVREHKKRYFFGLLALVSVDLINVCLPLVVRDAIDALPEKKLQRVLWAGFAYFALMALQAAGRYLWRIYLIGTSHAVAKELRLKLYGHLQRLPLAYYQRVRTGDLMSRATNDIESIRMAVGPGILVTMDALFIFIMIVPVMLTLSLKLSLLAFAFYPIVPWLTTALGDRIDTLFEKMQAKMSQLSAYTQESFGAVRLIKSLVLEQRVETLFRHHSLEYQKEGIRQAKYQAVFSPALGLLTSLGTFLILIVGGRDAITGAITVGTFVAFQRFVVQLSWPMEAIGWAVTMNKEGAAAQRRLDEVFRAPEVISVRAEARAAQPSSSLLEIRQLRHAFEGAGSRGFRLDVSDLRIRRGQKIGLVGRVGAGKSTLFNLLLRLYEPPEASVFWEGTDIAAIALERLRTQIASVEQQVFLFSEPVSVNVALGATREPTQEAIETATRTACIYDECLELAKGFGTPLGERGVTLSGGQKQRIALARALVRHPTLLLLDDSFSAVDVAIEHQIIEKFFHEHPDLALLFASHRLSVMPRMDEIWILEEGSVIDRGRHQDLLRTSALYQSLWEKSERKIEVARFESEIHSEEGAR